MDDGRFSEAADGRVATAGRGSGIARIITVAIGPIGRGVLSGC